MEVQWMMNKKNGQYLPLLIFIVVLIILTIIRFYSSNKIKKNSVFVVAKVFKVTEPGKSGRTYYCYYNYKGERFEISFLGRVYGLNDNGLVFVEVDTLHYGRSQLMEFTLVPECIKMDDVPFAGWKVLPKCK